MRRTARSLWRTTVDPNVKGVADEVKKLRPKLTGFRQAETITKSISVGKTDVQYVPLAKRA